MRATKILANAAIIFLVTLVLLVLLEVFLRIVMPSVKKASVRPQELAYEYNEDYLVSLKPGIRRTNTEGPENGGITVEWYTNRDAFRGDEIRQNPSMRIIVYGDSNIQAVFSQLEDTFPRRLEAYLGEAGLSGVEVLNAGVVGFGPDQCLLRFIAEIEKYQPDAVVFLVSDNDYSDIMKNRLFDLDSDGNVVQSRHKRTEDQLLRQERGVSAFFANLAMVRAAKRIRGEAPESSNAISTPQSVIQDIAAAIEREYEIFRRSGPREFSHFGDHYDLNVAAYPDSESSKAAVALMGGVLKRAKETAEKKGIQFLVVIEPSIVDLTENYLFSHEHLAEYPQYRKENLTDTTKNICVSNTIDVVDLFDVFSQNDPGNLFFRNKNNHWNDRGQDIAAKEVAEYMLDRIHR